MKQLQKQKQQKSGNPLAKEGKSEMQAIDGIEMKKGSIDKKQNSLQGGSVTENESFNRHYNKELKVSEDEIPIVLLELNESALTFISRDHFEKALLLLQKAHGVLDVVDISNCKRDQMIALEIFLNMSLCYQKLGQLEECSLCLETCIDQIYGGTKDENKLVGHNSIAMRVMKMKLECKLRMQLCAIYSQLHRHKEALEQAYESAKLSNVIIQDQIHICEFVSKRVDFSNAKAENNKGQGDTGNDDNGAAIIIDNFSSMSEEGGAFFGKRDELEEDSTESVRQYQTALSFNNNLEDSISLVERSAKKLLPIYRELLKRLVQLKKPEKLEELSLTDFDRADDEPLNIDSVKNKPKSQVVDRNSPEKKNQQSTINMLDMRHMLGFLNQTEWVSQLNIGNIMQISPIQYEDLVAHRRNEQEISRDSFLESVSFVIVAYFCISTEIRFIIQLKEEIPKFKNFDLQIKTKESEHFHAKSLEIACTFLPSDCPLLNHVLLSYQKHHAPSSSAIVIFTFQFFVQPEGQSTEEVLEVMKPLFGIENCKFQPIIRKVKDITVQLSPPNIKPATKTVTKLIKKIDPYSDISTLNPLLYETNNGEQQNSKMQLNGGFGQKDKIRKIMKFEKVMKRFCREIGIDKKTLFGMIMGQKNLNDSEEKTNQTNTTRKEKIGNSREGQQLNTGVAAQIAYNNMVVNSDPEQTPQQFPKPRNLNFKSRNQNHSLTENRTDPSGFIQQQQTFSEINRSSLNAQKQNYDSEASIFTDLKNNPNLLNENSFHEQMLDKNRININNTRENHNNSIIGTIMNKRQNSQEKINPMRPRSSKGIRGTISNQSIPLLPQQQLQSKYHTNKSEERHNKSQQQSRTIGSTGKSKPIMTNDSFSKHLQANLLQQNQSQSNNQFPQSQLPQNIKINKKSIDSSNNQGMSQHHQQSIQDIKKNKINYDDLKKYLIKEYQQQKVQQKLQNVYLKNDDSAGSINIRQKKSGSGSRQAKNQVLSQQQQQQVIYLTQQQQMRPISQGAIGHMKKRDKNKQLIQELLMPNQNKQKIGQGAPIVGLVGNHNLSVNITNIAGNVNGLRQQMFFEDDFKNMNNNNSSFVKMPNNNGSMVGVESFLPGNQKISQILASGNLSFDARRMSQPQ